MSVVLAGSPKAVDQPDRDEREPGAGACRVVIRGLGTATPGQAVALAAALPVDVDALKKALAATPSLLAAGLDRRRAERVREALVGVGLEVDVLGPDDRFAAGRPELDVALVARDPARVPAIIARLAGFLGVSKVAAAALLWRTPAVVLRAASAPTVDALRARLEGLGAELDVTRQADARYDLFLDASAERQRDRAHRLIRHAGLRPHEGTTRAAPVVEGLGLADAERMAAALAADRVGARAVPVDFQRFDVTIPAAEGAEIPGWLGGDAGVRRTEGALLMESVRRGEMERLVQSALEHGTRAEARLATLRRYALRLVSVGTPSAVETFLCRGLAQEPARARAVARARGGVVHGPFPSVQARWARHELERRGSRVRLLER